MFPKSSKKWRIKGAYEPILKPFDFEIEQGACSLFLGKSGSGKTTLLRYMAGVDLDGMRKAFVAQALNLFPHMSVLKNCVHPQIHVLKRPKKEAEAKARQLLQQLGISELAERMPHQLSGGQKQRAAIARALCMDAQLLLMDEPTSALDPESTRELTALLKELQEKGLTFVIATHDMEFANQMHDRIFIMESGQMIERASM